MDPLKQSYDERLRLLLDETASFDIRSDDFTAASKNLGLFSTIRTNLPDPDPTPDPVPVTRWEKVKAGMASVWDNETTRVLIKAGGAFAGVAVVVYSTIHKDHVVERNALSQANQRNS